MINYTSFIQQIQRAILALDVAAHVSVLVSKMHKSFEKGAVDTTCNKKEGEQS